MREQNFRALEVVYLGNFKPFPAVEALISQQFLLKRPSSYDLRSMKSGQICLPTAHLPKTVGGADQGGEGILPGLGVLPALHSAGRRFVEATFLFL